MRILVTRPAEDGAATAGRLAARGHEAVLAPLMTVRLHGAAPSLEGVQALLVTSANGARALAAALGADPAPRALPVLAVGEASAEAARAAGFSRVEAAGGDVTALAALVRARLDAAGGALLHAAGSVTAGDLAGDLGRDGFTVRRVVLYTAEPAAALPEAARAALAAGALDGVLLYSPRTARLFAGLVRAAGLEAACGSLTAFCLSPAVADALGDLPVAERRTAARPEQEALLALL